jgi:hypothetical protein
LPLTKSATQLPTAPQTTWEETEGEHRRIEVRTDWHGTDISWFAAQQRWPWPGLGGLGMVIAEREDAIALPLHRPRSSEFVERVVALGFQATIPPRRSSGWSLFDPAAPSHSWTYAQPPIICTPPP